MAKFIVLALAILGLMALSIMFMKEQVYIPPAVTGGALAGIAGSLSVTGFKLWLAERKTAKEKKDRAKPAPQTNRE